MKKILFKRWKLFIAILIIGSVVVTGVLGNAPKRYIQFICGGQKINTIFFGDNVMLSFGDGSSIKLPKVLSASGVRFKNSDESIVFWTKGEGAMYKAPGVNGSVECITENTKVKITPTIVITPIKYEIAKQEYQGVPRVVTFSGKNAVQSQDNEYFNIVKDKIIKEKLSAQSWFQNRCNEFWLSEQKDSKYFTIERHGYHQNGCPGDPMTSPRYDTFLVDMKTKEVFYDDVVAAKTITFTEWAKTINKD